MRPAPSQQTAKNARNKQSAKKLAPLDQRLRARHNAAKTTRQPSAARRCIICSQRIPVGAPVAAFYTADLIAHWTCFNTESMRKGAQL